MWNESNKYKELIDEISKKFNYDKELSDVLNRVTEGILDGKSEDEKNIFFKMLSHTPIVVLPYDTRVNEDEIVEEYIGNVNPHIQDEKVDIGAYGESVPAGAFVSEAILDENLNITGTKQFLFVKRVANFTERGKKVCEMFGTDINIQHLIHELGHAENAEINQYTMEGNTLVQRVGTANIKSEIKKIGDGKYIKKEIGRTGLMLEEGINTNEEQEKLCKYLEIDQEALRQLYRDNILGQSDYQGLMSDITKHFMERTDAEAIRMWRLTGDSKYIDTINRAMQQTDPYKKRNDDTEYIKDKRKIFSTPISERMKSFFEKYNKDFFPDKSNMTPIELLDNCLLQCFDIKTHNFYAFDPSSEEAMSKYKECVQSVIKEGYVLINQTSNNLEKSTISMKSLTKNALKDKLTEEEVIAAGTDRNEQDINNKTNNNKEI